ncbi:vacuolar fusion protein MON1 [Lentinula novae-zelandiae]|nr:vacuolar fusion protein MON1 [Lentinula novae-zelandiae]
MNSGSHSSASSVINLELDNTNGNRILVQDVEAEVDSIDEDVYQNKPGNESKEGESKKILRDQLRRTLTTNLATTEASFTNRGPARWLPDSQRSFHSKLSPREYFILTDAGKPVYISRGTDTDDIDVSSMLGVMQALISVFIDDGDKLKSINAGKTRITFLQRQPLYYACVSTWGEPESVARSQLEYLHLQILSVVTSVQLKRIFERRGNFDLRRLLGGADTFLTTMIARLQLDLAISMSALRCLRLDPFLRNKLAQALVPSGKFTKDILYIILVTQGEIITIVRPRKHSVHPADIHILLTTLASPSISNSPAAAMWVPLCLPKWNEGRMVNAYVVNIPYMLGGNSNSSGLEGTSGKRETQTLTSRSITLVCISGGSDFDSVRAWCDEAVENSPANHTSSSSFHHLRTHISHSSYAISELGIPGLRHFVYKARGLVQVTYPADEKNEGETDEKKRIITLYQLVHDAIHAKGMSNPGKGEVREGLKLQYLRTETEAVLGWITQPFELYLTLSPLLPKSAAVGAANAVARWVKKEEGKLFLKDAPVF